MRNLSKIVVSALFVFSSFNFHAQINQGTVPDDIEVISVTGQRSSASLLKAYELAKFQMYEVYNELNTESKFTVDCRIVKYVGSQIAKRECLPRFFREASADHTSLALLTESNPGYDPSLIRSKTRELEREFYAHIAKLAEDSPELTDRLVAISESLSSYLSAKYDDEEELAARLASDKDKLERGCSLTSACFRSKPGE